MVHWARFRSDDARTGFGALDGGGRIAEYEGDLFGASQPTGRAIERGGYALLCPCTPSKIIALWNNFHALSGKLGKAAPAHPLFFLKPGTSVVGPDDKIRRPASYAGKIAYEGELGIVIGRRCKDVSVEDAAGYIFGYTCVNDVTAAEVLNENPDFVQWCRSKGFDTFGCLGPVIATGWDGTGAHVTTKVDGVVRQNYPLSDMIFPPAALVSQISHDMTLLPGDVIACGTSVGVGSLREGCQVEVQIEGIGSLVNAFEPP